MDRGWEIIPSDLCQCHLGCHTRKFQYQNQVLFDESKHVCRMLTKKKIAKLSATDEL